MSDDDGDDNPTPTAFSSADPPRNFALPIGERIRALTIGPPAFATRKKHIEDLLERHLRMLVAQRDLLHARSADPTSVERVLLERASALELAKLNRLIATHNRYYPIEANLAIDPRTGAYLIYGQPWEPEPVATPERLVEEALTRRPRRRA